MCTEQEACDVVKVEWQAFVVGTEKKAYCRCVLNCDSYTARNTGQSFGAETFDLVCIRSYIAPNLMLLYPMVVVVLGSYRNCWLPQALSSASTCRVCIVTCKHEFDPKRCW